MPLIRDFLRRLFTRDSAPEITADISGLRSDGSPYATCYIRMASLIHDLLACFPGYDQAAEKSLPSEIPFPYTYKVLVNRPAGEIELLVYHQDTRGLFPGLWRHPDGTHFYFEGETSQKFLDIVNISGINTAGANKTDAGNGSQGICRVINASHSTPPDPRRSPNSTRHKSK